MNIGRETLSKDKLDAMTPPSPYHRIRNFIRKPEIAWPVSLFLVTRSFLALLGYELWLSGIVHTTSESHARLYSGILPVVNGAAGVLLGVWQRWDAIHYLRIAAGGYTTPKLHAFPPLYPLLVRLVGTLFGGDMLLGGIIVSSVACFLLLVVLHKRITDDGFGLDVAKRSLTYLVIFPTAFFLFAPYTESLFALLCVVTLREARRERWVLASVAAFAATLTRVVGVVLIPVLAVEILRSVDWDLRRLGARLAAAFSPAIGFGIFLGWLAWSGVPSITELQSVFWDRFPAFPWQAIILAFQQIFAGEASPVEYLDISAVLLMLGLGVLVVKRLPLSYSVFFWVSLIFNLSQVRAGRPLSGQARFCVPLFPAFIVLAQLGRSPRWNRIIFYPSVILWAGWAGAFMIWGWVG